MNCIHVLVFPCLLLLAGISIIHPASLVLKRRPFYPFSNCTGENYLCKNGKCIAKKLFCNQINNCGDNSDEEYCSNRRGYNYNCPTHYSFSRCQNDRCIPTVWYCDGIADCTDGSDEARCNLENKVQGIKDVFKNINMADSWLRHQAFNKSTTNKWGTNVLRTSVALYFADSKYFKGNNATGQSITYEVSQRLLEALIREEMGVDTLSANDLAVYINALSVSCTDARDFNGLNLVTRLANEADDTPEQPSPFVLLSLCNSGYNLTSEQISELYSFFEKPTRTDKLAFALMALSCVADRGNVQGVPFVTLTPLATKLKQRQHEDGSFENAPTTSLAMQALIASGEVDGFALTNAAKYLLKQQDTNGSFGSLLNTYYAMPVLQYKSLLDLDTSHCDFEAEDNKKEIEDFQGKFAKYVHVAYSIGIGDSFNLVHTITIRVPVNSTFFEVMKTSAALDEKYRFKYVLLDSKPHIYELCGIQDDAERERYWYLFGGAANSTTAVRTSPADVVVRENGNFMMWYRTPDHLRKFQNSTLLRLE